MGLVACVACSQVKLLPATINFDETLPNEPYDFVPNIPRSQSIDSFVSTTAAFGGTNVVLVGGKLRPKPTGTCEPPPSVSITGIGVVSAQGCGTRELAASLLESQCAWHEYSQANEWDCEVRRVAKVKDFDARRLLSSLRLRGVDSMAQYAAAAVRLALQDSGFPLNYDPDRIGIVTGVSRPSHDTLEKLLEALEGPWASLNVSKNLLRKGRFLIASQLANWYRCRGFSATITDGLATTGLTALSVAAQQLSRSEQLDAVIVVAADHASLTSLRLWETQGCLATGDELMVPYSEQGQGMILGEGAVALVLQRTNQCSETGTRPIANILSVGSTFDASIISQDMDHDPWLETEPTGRWLTAAIQVALTCAGVRPEEVGSVLGNGCGIAEYDQRELHAVRRALGADIHVDSVNSAIGVLEASSGLMSVAAASAAMAAQINHDETGVSVVRHANPHDDLPSRASLCSSTLDRPSNSLVVGSSEKGRNVAILLGGTGPTSADKVND